MKQVMALVICILASQAFAVSPDQIIAEAILGGRLSFRVEDAADAGESWQWLYRFSRWISDNSRTFESGPDAACVSGRHRTKRRDFRLAFPLEAPTMVRTVALWRFLNLQCRYAVTLSTKYGPRSRPCLGSWLFPGNDGLTLAKYNINNLTSQRGFYKADGYLRPIRSGGPVFNVRQVMPSL